MRVWEDLTYKELYDFIGISLVYEAGKKEELNGDSFDSEKSKEQCKILKKDLTRTGVIDENNDPMPINKAWLDKGAEVDINYSQLDMGCTAEAFSFQLSQKIEFVSCKDSCASIHFNYQDSGDTLCNFSLFHLKEGQYNKWLLVILRNAHCLEAEKEVFIGVSGFDLNLFNRPEGQEHPEPVADIYEMMQEQINSPAIFKLFRHMFSPRLDRGSSNTELFINPDFQIALSTVSKKIVHKEVPDYAPRVAMPSRILEILGADDTNDHLVDFFMYMDACANFDFSLGGKDAGEVNELKDFIEKAFNSDAPEYNSVKNAVSKIMFSENTLFSFMEEETYSALKEYLKAFLASKDIFYVDPYSNPYEGINMTAYWEAMRETVFEQPVLETEKVVSVVEVPSEQTPIKIYRLTYEAAFALVKSSEMYSQESKDYQDDVKKDLYRSRFFDEERGPNFFTSAWSEAAKEQNYLNYNQRDMIGGPFISWFYSVGLDSNGEAPVEDRYEEFCFGYRDDDGRICGLDLAYEKNNLQQWILSVMRNANCPDASKEVWITTSGWEDRYFDPPQNHEETAVVEDLYAEIEKQINSSAIFDLFKKMIVAPEFYANQEFISKIKKQYEASLKDVGKSQGKVRLVIKPSELENLSNPALTMS